MANKEANSNQNGIKEEGKMKHALSLGDSAKRLHN